MPEAIPAASAPIPTLATGRRPEEPCAEQDHPWPYGGGHPGGEAHTSHGAQAVREEAQPGVAQGIAEDALHVQRHEVEPGELPGGDEQTEEVRGQERATGE